MNLTGGEHTIEVLHWFSGTAGFNLIAAYEAGEITEFARDDFELMPAFSGERAPFVITNVEHAAAGVVIEWQSSVGVSYILERSITLDEDWSELEDGIASDGALTSYTDENPPAGTAYYRVRR